ncbi:MAG TPA: carbon starvation CstA family protein [Verrucomicrobiae bacterium]|nr:carbon starvation CstA family protein [Verrucomicrobiae bacterium]
MKRVLFTLFWVVMGVLGAVGYATLALHRGEPVNSVYVLLAAICSYTIGYRFYSKWVAARVLALTDRRATPCEVREDGRDFVRTNKWIVFGHHFAAISGPGPLVGPVLAAQFGYLPGALWILIGVVIGGAVQDFVILFCSMRRNGSSLGQMVKEELNTAAGMVGVAAILAIMIILLAVLALVVVQVLGHSPWGVFTVGATIPIALFMGGYLRFWRVGKVLEVSALGVVLLLLAVWGGQFVHGHPIWSQRLTLTEEQLAWSILIYGLAASILPVWLLLAPRDYLSTFMKLGTILALVLGVLLVRPNLQMPAISRFVDGSGLVLAGKLFPFCFITIACGAISGFHALISSGITPKIITRESYARPIGYGAMCLESLVAIMALVAACSLEPGVYLSMNVKGDPAATIQKVSSLGFPVQLTQMEDLAHTVGEQTLFGRTGGAATLAVGMAQIFSKLTHGRWLDLWYHFATMFEALFILTTLDAGTRVGRYLLQDVMGSLWKPLRETRSVPANVLASALVVGSWGYFLIQGVRDPLGGINSLWPLFGIANQLLASIALCLATTVILKMQLGPASLSASTANPKPRVGRPVFALVTLIPLAWLLTVTMTAGVQKIFHPDPRIGFLKQAAVLDQAWPALEQTLKTAQAGGQADQLKAAAKALRTNRAQRFNNRLDAVVAGLFLALVATIVALSAFEWALLFLRKRPATLRESEAVWLPDYALHEAKPVGWLGVLALALGLARELSGETALARAEAVGPGPERERTCDCGDPSHAVQVDLLRQSAAAEAPDRGRLFEETLKRRFEGVHRCC